MTLENIRRQLMGLKTNAHCVIPAMVIRRSSAELRTLPEPFIKALKLTVRLSMWRVKPLAVDVKALLGIRPGADRLIEIIDEQTQHSLSLLFDIIIILGSAKRTLIQWYKFMPG